MSDLQGCHPVILSWECHHTGFREVDENHLKAVPCFCRDFFFLYRFFLHIKKFSLMSSACIMPASCHLTWYPSSLPSLIVLCTFLQTPEEPRPSLPTSRLSQQDHEPDPSEEGFSRPPSTCSKGQRDTAARILQARWKRYCQQVRAWAASLSSAPSAAQALCSVLLACMEMWDRISWGVRGRPAPGPKVGPTGTLTGSSGGGEGQWLVWKPLLAH